MTLISEPCVMGFIQEFKLRQARWAFIKYSQLHTWTNTKCKKEDTAIVKHRGVILVTHKAN